MKKCRVNDEGNDLRILKSLQDKSGIIDKEIYSPRSEIVNFPVSNSEFSALVSIANLVVEKMREVLGPAIFSMTENFGVNAQELVRSQSLFHACKGAREKKGLTVKQAAAILRVPQYWIKALEGGPDRSSIRADILERYIEFLELSAFYGEWIKANQDIFARWEDRRR